MKTIRNIIFVIKNIVALSVALIVAYLCVNIFFTVSQAMGAELEKDNYRQLLDAMCEVESNCDPTKVGKANEIGWYQILPDFWTDALEYDPSIGGEYEDVAKDKEYAEKVILAYWDRYATIKRLGRVPTDEDRARIHNGGPNGYKKEATIAYWSKVRKELDE